jgi:hypothetical protein
MLTVGPLRAAEYGVHPRVPGEHARSLLDTAMLDVEIAAAHAENKGDTAVCAFVGSELADTLRVVALLFLHYAFLHYAFLLNATDAWRRREKRRVRLCRCDDDDVIYCEGSPDASPIGDSLVTSPSTAGRPKNAGSRTLDLRMARHAQSYRGRVSACRTRLVAINARRQLAVSLQCAHATEFECKQDCENGLMLLFSASSFVSACFFCSCSALVCRSFKWATVSTRTHIAS